MIAPPPHSRSPSPSGVAAPGREPRRALPLAFGMGAAAFLSVVATLGGPGITCDEPLDVRPGTTYVSTLLRQGRAFWSAATIDRVFRDNAEHPPLGRWLLGIAATLGAPWESSLLGGADPFDVHAGRLAPAAAFGLLVGLVFHAAASRRGLAAGGVAAGALIMMPRVWTHAHLGALDTFLACFFTAALLAAESACQSRRPFRSAAAAGLVWGLAILVKMPAWLLIPVVWGRAIGVLGIKRGALAAMIWTSAGLAVFFVGWPWLWFHSYARLKSYFSTGFERVSIHTLYLGTVYSDHSVPWHYAPFYFLATVPVGLHLLGFAALPRVFKRALKEGFPAVLAAIVAGVLLLFMLKFPIYDGERLFLFVFPLWAILIGYGYADLHDRLAARAWARRLPAALFFTQCVGLVATYPLGLSYYNLAIGGAKGAERMGLELTYWGDAIDHELLNELARRAAPGDAAAVVPTLHHIQAAASTSEALAAKNVRLVSQESAPQAQWIVVSRREAYWPPELREWLRANPPVRLRKCQGVWLSGIWMGPYSPRQPALNHNPNLKPIKELHQTERPAAEKKATAPSRHGRKE